MHYVRYWHLFCVDLFDFFTFFCKNVKRKFVSIVVQAKRIGFGCKCVVHDIFLLLVIDSKVIESISDVDNVA